MIEKCQLEKMLKDGLRTKDICKKINKSHKTVLKYIHLFNLNYFLRIKGGIKYTDLETFSNLYFSNKISFEKMANYFGYSQYGLRYLLRKLNLWKIKTEKTKHYIFDETFFEKIDTEAKAYFLGFIMADGCVYIGKKNDHLLRIHIKDNDNYILEKFTTEIKLNKKLTYKNGYVEIKIFSKKLINDLIKLKCTQRKSLTLEFPNQIINSPFLSDFIRGYFDGDGTVCWGNRKKYKWIKIGFYSSYIFNKELLNILNNKYNIYSKINNKDKICELASHGFENAKKYYDFLYQNATIFLKRKKDKFEEILKYKNLID